jgi:hypothetical protein
MISYMISYSARFQMQQRPQQPGRAPRLPFHRTQSSCTASARTRADERLGRSQAERARISTAHWHDWNLASSMAATASHGRLGRSARAARFNTGHWNLLQAVQQHGLARALQLECGAAAPLAARGGCTGARRAW